MFFTQDDRSNLIKLLTSIEGNKANLFNLAQETHHLITIIKQLVINVEQMANDQETLKSRMIALENMCTPKPPTPVLGKKKK